MQNDKTLIATYGDPNLAPPACETLKAGPISVVFTANGDLRYIRYGEQQLILRIYAAVRASDWWTVPATITIQEKTVTPDSFHIVYTASYIAEARGIDFQATVTLTGESHGRITFDFNGEARSDFDRNRIGICVLHPAEAKGALLTVTHTNGTEETGYLPDTISPHQPFFDIAAIRHTPVPGIEAELTFSGDIFEMEDQRNWLDASFKTYSTPLSLPSPVRMPPGDRVQQAVALQVQVAPDFVMPATVSPITETTESPTKSAIGIVWTETMAKPGFALANPLVSYLWVDLDLRRRNWRSVLLRADKAAQNLGVALHVLLRNASIYRQRAGILQLNIPPTQANTQWFALAQDWEAVTRYFEPQQKVVGIGYTSNFTEMNRNRPQTPPNTPLFFAGNPQVHAIDSLSIAETPPIIAEVIRTARTFANGRPIHIGPLTFTGGSSINDARESASFGNKWYQQVLQYAQNAGADYITLGTEALRAL